VLVLRDFVSGRGQAMNAPSWLRFNAIVPAHGELLLHCMIREIGILRGIAWGPVMLSYDFGIELWRLTIGCRDITGLLASPRPMAVVCGLGEQIQLHVHNSLHVESTVAGEYVWESYSKDGPPTVQEAPCKVCGHLNDKGTLTCWWCGTSFPVEVKP
jgi:hypothetical protein